MAGKRFFTSDIHFDDSRLNLYGRDLVFANSEEFDKFVIDRWNSVVDKDDLVIVVGDVSMTRKGLDNMKLLNGEKWLIKGNYDNPISDGGTAKYEISDEILYEYFDKVKDQYVITIGDEDVFINHYPTNARQDVFNIVGHIHGTWKVQRNMINVGMDAWHFTPISEDVIKFQMNGVRVHYDQNVFAGELVANTSNRNGKVTVLHAPDYGMLPYIHGNEDIVIFLAGPIQGAPNWQDEVIRQLTGIFTKLSVNRNIVICSPRRGAMETTFEYDEQVNWESYHLDLASKYGVLVFWLPLEEAVVEGRSYAQTTRFEIGEWFAKGQNIQDLKLSFGVEPGFSGARYIVKKFIDAYPDIIVNSSLEDLTRNIAEKIIERF
jgi:calcineurin-like phosphoesterase family protein